MCIRIIGVWLLASVWLLAGAGCKKSSPVETSPAPDTQVAAPQAPSADTIARLHWLGKKRLEGETNAAFFMSLWDLPESAKLEAQTLDKLASACAREISGDTNLVSLTNSTLARIIRPVLEDLIKEESYVDVRWATNQPGELALAIRLNEDRAGYWKTNLPKVFESISGPATVTSGANRQAWEIKFENQTSKTATRLSLNRVGTWTLFTLGRASALAALPVAPTLVDELTARIQKQNAPVASVSNSWLECDFDLARIGNALACDWSLPCGLPEVSLTTTGDGLNVRTRGQIAFPKPLGLEIEAWNIPTNLVHNPLVSFTALNGVRQGIAAIPAWQNLKLETAPSQIFLWGNGGAAVETYFAAPLQGASNAIYALSGTILDSCNPFLASNKMGEFQRASDGNGLSWQGFPFVAPFLKETTLPGGGFAFGGLGPESSMTNRMPEALIQELTAHTNLVYYDWEITGPKIEAVIYITQALRMMSERSQLPAQSASILWLKALVPRLGNCGTEFTATDATHLSFVRKSPLGFTAIELQLLADWLESPSFPRGFYTFEVPGPKPVRERVASSPR